MKILLLIILVSQFAHQIQAIVCSNPKPYQYNGVCYPQCPWSPPTVTYLDTQTGNCLTNCPAPLYFADDSTKTCTQNCPSYPTMTYYDHVRQKCVEKCPSAPSQFAYATNRSCLAECPDPLYADQSTRNCVASCPTKMFYQIVGTLRICTSRCYPNYYANQSKICVTADLCPSTPVTYYGDDLSGLCVKSCPQNSDTYAEQSTRKCVQHCTLGTFADPTTLRCVSSCPTMPAYYGSNTTRMCHLQCIEGEFAYKTDRQCYAVCPQGFGDYSTRTCVDLCPEKNNTFADPQTKLCITVCSPGYYADNNTRSCVSAVDCTGDLVGNPINLRCIDGQDCPVGYFIDYTLFLCVKRCISSEYANLDTRVCGTDCPWNPPINITFKDDSTKRCLLQCPANPRTFSDNVTQSCVDTCPDPYFGSPLNYDCVDTCPDGFYGETLTNLCISTCTTNTSSILYFYSFNTSCLSACPQGTYKDNTTLTCVQICPDDTYALEDTNQCVPNCPNTTFADNHSRSCVGACPAITKQYADDSTNLCVDVCPLSPDYFGEDLNDGKRKCVLNCTLTDVFADPITRTCVKQCNYDEGYFGYQTDKRCVLKCPVGYGNPITKLCTATCPQSPIQTYGDNLTSTCVRKCPNTTYGDKTQQLCVNATDCPNNTYGDDSTNLCVSKCSALLGTYGDPATKRCVKSCQFGYYTDNTTRLCTQTCNITAKLYKDPSTRRCVLDCPSNPDLYNDPANKQCVPNCTSAIYPYKYRYMNVRKCVSMCPTSPAYFADQQTKNCVLRCANGTFKFVNNTYRGCLSYCPLQIFNVTVNTTLYEDNTTWTCVAVCPPGYYAFKHPTDSTIRKCVKMCQIINNIYYFADDVSRSCVTQCPTKVYNTWGDRLIFKCVKNCTRKQYRDNTTKQCTYNCPDTPVQYFADNSTWNCTKTCPNGTFAQSVNNTCVKQCPTNTYGYAQKCMSACPANTTVYQDNTTWLCVNKCTMLPDYYSDAGNQKCVKNCTGNTFADWETRSCVAALKCTGTTVADPLTFRCVAQCSKVPMYFVTSSTNLCGAFCTGGLFAFNDTNKCVQECPAPYYGVNSSTNFYCTQYCPTGEYKFINKTLFRICISGCPTGYFSFGPSMQCVQLCPDGYWGNSSNNQCVQDCTPLYADDTTNMCVDICPNDTTADNHTYSCKGKCKYGQFMEDKVCVTACSPGLFADNLTRACLNECPADPFTFADPFVNKCVFQCSNGYFGYFDNRTCELGSCPTGLFKQTLLRICINPCLEGQFGDPQSLQCVTTCAGSTYFYADPTSQQCVMKCPSSPDLYGLTNKCIDQCPPNKFAQNETRTCVNICPNKTANTLTDSYADDLTRRCVSRCSALSYAYQNITHNVCINNCTNDLFASEIQQACVKICPNTTFARNDTHECASRCPSGSWGDTNTKICMDGCYNSQFSDNSTNMCVDKCPSDPDLYGDKATNSCVLKCQSGFYAHPIDRLCVSYCDAPYYADPSSLLCVLDCPLHEFIYADDYNRTCMSKCKNYSGVIYYADPTTKKCKTQCPQLPQLLYGLNKTNTCEQTCPPGTFGDNDTRLCLKECIFQSPKFTWMDRVDNMCVKQCPLGYFSDNKTRSCEQVCSVGMYADNSTRKCVYGCPVNPSSFAALDAIGNPVCTYTCKSGLYADEVSRSCVPTCPLSPFYYFHMNLTNSCEKECLFPYFGEKESQFCVPKCKDGFYGNLTTKKCETCRTQCVTCSAYLECLTCQIGFYLYEFECVTACPTYPILYFSLESSTKCFKKCPAPYYGLESTKKCQLGCPVSYYPNDLTRICTLCPTGCLTCDSKGCLSCLKGYTYLNTTRSCNQYCNITHIYYFKDQCYNTCPQGSFLSKDLVHCDACASECAACSLSAANCTKCANKFYYQGLCVDACPNNYFVNQELACIACSVNPERCKLDPLTYNITPFTENFKQKAYVTFSRPVSMTLDEFAQAVQINFNGKALKSGEFSAVVFNSTTYVVTILISSNQESLKIQYKPRSMQQTQTKPQSQQISQQPPKVSQNFPSPKVSLNQNSLTIGFKPGTITDTSGNMLTVNSLEQKFEASADVISEQTALLTQKISSSALAITWIFMVIVLLLLIKTGYPVLILLEVAQIIYMHIYLYAGPMPFLELKFLDELKSFHFTFFPQLFAAGITEKAYQNVSVDLSFLANASPLIFVWGIVGFVYLLFAILSSKKLKSSKMVRKFAKRARKYRLKFGIINDAFWITYIYAMFFAMYQFKKASFGNGLMVGNFFLACVVFVLYIIFTVYMVKVANQHKGKTQEEIPKKVRFISPQPSSFPMEMPMRYIRKLCLCFALVMPSFEAQIVIMLMTNIIFMTYCMCFTPSKSKLTNYVNFVIEIGYIVLQGLFYAYFKLQQKTSEEQIGFAFTLITVQALMLLIVFVWTIFRLIGDFKQSQIWKYIYMKLTQNNDPEYLKHEQKKRDLEFDFGSLENQSQLEDHQISSKNLQLKKRTFNQNKVFFDAEVGAKKQKKAIEEDKKQKKSSKRTSTELSATISINEKSLQQKSLMKNSSSKDQVSQSAELNDKQLQSTIKVLQPKKTRIKTPFAGKRSEVLNIDSLSDLHVEQVVIYNNEGDEEKKEEKKCIWDDVEFDENEI